MPKKKAAQGIAADAAAAAAPGPVQTPPPAAPTEQKDADTPAASGDAKAPTATE